MKCNLQTSSCTISAVASALAQRLISVQEPMSYGVGFLLRGHSPRLGNRDNGILLGEADSHLSQR